MNREKQTDGLLSQITSLLPPLISDNMASSSAMALLVLIVSWMSMHALSAAQSFWNQSNVINGTAIPPLIEATTEDLLRGLESGLFTSVDLVSVCPDRGL